MSVLGKRRSRKSSPQHAFPPSHLSSSFSKLRRFINDIKAKQQYHRDMVVEIMGTSPFPFFPVSQASPMPSPCKSSAKVVQSGVSIPVIPRKLPALADPVRTESTAQTVPSVAAKQLRNALTIRQSRRGAEFIMLALLVLGFLCVGKAAAVCITVTAYLLFGIGTKLASLDLSFWKSGSRHSISDLGSDSSDCGTMADDFEDQRWIQTPVNPSTTSGLGLGSPCCLERCASREHRCAAIKLGALLLVVLFGLLHGRVAAVFVATCSVIVLSKVYTATEAFIQIIKNTKQEASLLPSRFLAKRRRWFL